MLGRGNEAQLIRQAEQGDFTQLRTLLHEHAANRRVMLGAFARIRNACTTDVRAVVYSRHLMRAVLCGNSGISKTTEAESCRTLLPRLPGRARPHLRSAFLLASAGGL